MRQRERLFVTPFFKSKIRQRFMFPVRGCKDRDIEASRKVIIQVTVKLLQQQQQKEATG